MIEFLIILIAVVLFCYFLYNKDKKNKEEQEMDRIAKVPNMSVSAEVLPLNKNDMKENQNQYDKYQFFLDNGLFNRPRRSTFCCSYQASMLVSSADTKH